MKKDEFFAQLRTAFAGMDEELLTDILGDYENHFKEGIENGKSEEEICEELGNVEEIRQAFLDENPAAMTINVNSNSDTVGNSDIYNRFYPGIQRVNAQLTDADIEIKKSSTNDVELSVTGGLADDMEALKETLRVSASVGTLSIQQEKKAGISVSYAASRLFGLKVGKYSARIVIHIAVPEQFEKIEVKSISGDIKANNSNAKTLLIHTGSGDVGVEDCQADELFASSISGDVNVIACKADKMDIVSVSGDIKVEFYVDEHHTIEDTALALGEALHKALGDKRGIERYGFMLPMDDCNCTVALDFGGRPWLVWEAEFRRERIGDTPREMFLHLIKSHSDADRMNLYNKAEGQNEHHKIEGIFKALARALKAAVHRDIFRFTLPSTKGTL